MKQLRDQKHASVKSFSSVDIKTSADSQHTVQWGASRKSGTGIKSLWMSKPQDHIEKFGMTWYRSYRNEVNEFKATKCFDKTHDGKDGRLGCYGGKPAEIIPINPNKTSKKKKVCSIF